jgi:nicotinamide-nucleotide amidase
MPLFSSDLLKLSQKVGKALKKKKLRLATAESCTGGLIAALLTEIPGSSAILDGGFVTYANGAKTKALGVPHAMIRKYGAVSAQVAEAMAKGALKHSNASVAVSVTGIAGPDGGSKEKPVGLVFIGFASKKSGVTHMSVILRERGRRSG